MRPILVGIFYLTPPAFLLALAGPRELGRKLNDLHTFPIRRFKSCPFLRPLKEFLMFYFALRGKYV